MWKSCWAPFLFSPPSPTSRNDPITQISLPSPVWNSSWTVHHSTSPQFRQQLWARKVLPRYWEVPREWPTFFEANGKQTFQMLCQFYHLNLFPRNPSKILHFAMFRPPQSHQNHPQIWSFNAFKLRPYLHTALLKPHHALAAEPCHSHQKWSSQS